MIKVYTADNPVDAHLLKGLLEGEGIEAEVRGEFLWGCRGEIPLLPETSPSVWVIDDADRERAGEIIAVFIRHVEMDRKAGRDDGGWACPACGAPNEGRFTDCWKCGTGRG